jgi:hypothetical protein
MIDVQPALERMYCRSFWGGFRVEGKPRTPELLTRIVCSAFVFETFFTSGSVIGIYPVG